MDLPEQSLSQYMNHWVARKFTTPFKFMVFLVIEMCIFFHNSHLPIVVDSLCNQTIDNEQVEEGEQAESSGTNHLDPPHVRVPHVRAGIELAQVLNQVSTNHHHQQT